MLKTSPATIPKLMKTNPTNESTRTDKQQTHANNYNKLNQIVILEYRTNELLKKFMGMESKRSGGSDAPRSGEEAVGIEDAVDEESERRTRRSR